MSDNGGKMRMPNRRRSNLSILPCSNQDFTAPGPAYSPHTYAYAYSAPDPGLRMAIRSYCTYWPHAIRDIAVPVSAMPS